MQIADYFPTKRSTVITIFSGAFSASPIVFVALKYTYDSGISFFSVILVLVFLSLFMLPFTYLLLPPISVKNDEKIKKSNIELNSYQKSSEKVILAQLSPELNGNSKIKIVSNGIQEENQTNGNNKTLRNNNKNKNLKHKEEEEVFINSGDSPPLATVGSNDVPLGVSLWSCAFNLHQLWFSWLNAYMVLYSGSMNLWLDRVTSDTQRAGGFTEIFGIVQVGGLIIAPIAGLFMDYNILRANRETDPFKRKIRRAQSGFWPILLTTIVLSISVKCRFFNTAGAVYSSIVFIALLRSFSVAVASAYLRIRYKINFLMNV
jgi:hypothetical protein